MIKNKIGSICRSVNLTIHYNFALSKEDTVSNALLRSLLDDIERGINEQVQLLFVIEPTYRWSVGDLKN